MGVLEVFEMGLTYAFLSHKTQIASALLFWYAIWIFTIPLWICGFAIVRQFMSLQRTLKLIIEWRLSATLRRHWHETLCIPDSE